MISIEIEGKTHEDVAIERSYILKDAIVLYRNKKIKNISNMHSLINSEEGFCILYSLTQSLKRSLEKEVKLEVNFDLFSYEVIKNEKEDKYNLKIMQDGYIIEDIEADLILIVGILEENGACSTTYINFNKNTYSNSAYIYTYLSYIQREMMRNIPVTKSDQEFYPKSTKSIIDEIEGV